MNGIKFRDRHTGQIKSLAREDDEIIVLLNSSGNEENWDRKTFKNTWEKMA
jgi:hypothetical protein